MTDLAPASRPSRHNADSKAPQRTDFLVIPAAYAALAQAARIDRVSDDVHAHRLVGQAVGILMERFEITAARALHCLQRVAAAGEVDLCDVARTVVDRVRARADAAVRDDNQTT